MDDENLTMAAGNNAYEIKPAASFHMLPVVCKAKKTTEHLLRDLGNWKN